MTNVIQRIMLFRITLLTIACIALAGCGAPDCSDRILQTKADYGGGLIAYRYLRNCGATTGYSTNIAIGRRGESLREAERVFTVDSDHGAADMDGNAVWMEMHWTAPHRLSVAYAEKARVFLSEQAAGGATIIYRATSRAPIVETPPPLE